MNILYYGEPEIERGGGVGKVAYYLPQALSRKVNVTYLSGIRSNKNFLGIYAIVFSQFVKREFDIIHFNSGPSWKNAGSLLLRFAKSRQIGTVLNIHGIPQLEWRAEQWHKSVSSIEWMRAVGHCHLADRIVVNSEYMRNNVVALYGVDRAKVVVIPNGVDLKIFAARNDRIFLEGNPSVLYVGHFARLKGIDVLIRAIAKLRSELPNIKLHLVGRGNVSYYAAIAKEEGIEKSVIFHNYAKQSMVSRYYRSADICVFPSRHEGFGIVILEAMASGIPVVASDIPSFREIISDGIDGLLFKAEDAEALSKQVVALWQDQHLRAELKHNAIEKAKKYSWEKIADKYICLYKNLIE